MIILVIWCVCLCVIKTYNYNRGGGSDVCGGSDGGNGVMMLAMTIVEA